VDKFCRWGEKYSQSGLKGILGIGLGKGGKLAGIKLPCSQEPIEIIQQFNYVRELFSYLRASPFYFYASLSYVGAIT